MAGPSAVAAVVDSCPDLRHVFQSGDRLAIDVGFWRVAGLAETNVPGSADRKQEYASVQAGFRIRRETTRGRCPPFCRVIHAAGCCQDRGHRVDRKNMLAIACQLCHTPPLTLKDESSRMFLAEWVSSMDYVYAAILGAVQGVAEFLPISSSGHLVIAQALLSAMAVAELPAWSKGATMNVALHFGTLLSIAVVYFRDLLAALKQPRLLLLIVIASVPVGMIGLLFKDQIEASFENPMAAGCLLLVTALLLFTAKRLQSGRLTMDQIPPWVAIVIGIFQAIAIMPGISRAGSTIAAGLSCGLKRADAAKFSFFIAVPAIGGATLLKLLDLIRGKEAVDIAWWPMMLGTAISFVVGVMCLRWLIRLLVADRLHWFAIYCLIVGALTIAWQSGLMNR